MFYYRNDQQVTCDYFTSFQAVGLAQHGYCRAVFLRNGAEVVTQADAVPDRLYALLLRQPGNARAK